jgi:bifunctional non-homologous end joining protein LigD
VHGHQPRDQTAFRNPDRNLMKAVVLGPDSVPNFDALHSRKHHKRAQLYAFDVLAGNGENHRRLPLLLRKANLTRQLKRRVDGIFIAEYEQGCIGQELFRAACRMRLEGIVSKRLDRAYSAGRCNHWIKVKNHEHPAYSTRTYGGVGAISRFGN